MGKPVSIMLGDLAHTYSVDNQSIPVPLSLAYIKAYAVAQHSKQVDISIYKNPEVFMSAVAEQRPKIVGFANYGWNENLTLQVGRWVRETLPDSLIVSGGPNIDENESLQIAYLEKHDYLDFAIIGGGEEPFSELIDWWSGTDRDVGNLPMNVIRNDGGQLHLTGERPLKKAIDNIESPYLGGYLDEFLSVGMFPMFETNRGCPFKCSFCAWGSASKDLVRRLDLEMALAEIDYVAERSQANVWIFCDANFGILKRDLEVARAIRNVKDRKGYPDKVQIWLAKNATDRNLQIGEVLGDMVVPVMAVQSLDEKVLKRIKRDNISTETYVDYQQKFHDLGHKTYSDLIVPLPEETLDSHLEALRSLVSYGVDIITNHNMRMLAGAETNLPETREYYGFETRYRLIHGDAGIYARPDGSSISTFEYEESVRRSTTMSEQDLFFLRKLHFLVDCTWNVELYKPLLKAALDSGINPIDVLIQLINLAQNPEPSVARACERLQAFFEDFDQKSHGEWFNSAEDIESYFAIPENFDRLINQEFEKLNILYTVILLQDYKLAFDEAIHYLIAKYSKIPKPRLDELAKFSFALFPPLDASDDAQIVEMADNIWNDSSNEPERSNNCQRREIRLIPSPRRAATRQVITMRGKNRTLSKILNTRGIELSDLRFAVDDSYAFDKQFRRASL